MLCEIDVALTDLQTICNTTDDDTVTEIARHAAEALSLLADQLPGGLHRRKCWACDNVAYHADRRIPYVLCSKCGSSDTRPTKETVSVPCS